MAQDEDRSREEFDRESEAELTESFVTSGRFDGQRFWEIVIRPLTSEEDRPQPEANEMAKR